MTAKIITSYWAKPIPIREFDYSATYDDYEGGDGYNEPSNVIGFGATEQEAIDDLKTNHPREEIHVRDYNDRWHTTLQLIASLPVGLKDNDRELLDSAVIAARAALAEPEHDPLCEVLR